MLGKSTKKPSPSSSTDTSTTDTDEEVSGLTGAGSVGGKATDDEIEFLDSFFGLKTPKSSKSSTNKGFSTPSSSTQNSGSGPDNIIEPKKRSNVRSIFESNPDKLKSPAIEEKEVEEEIDSILRSIREGKSVVKDKKPAGGVNPNVEEFSAHQV